MQGALNAVPSQYWAWLPALFQGIWLLVLVGWLRSSKPSRGAWPVLAPVVALALGLVAFWMPVYVASERLSAGSDSRPGVTRPPPGADGEEVSLPSPTRAGPARVRVLLDSFEVATPDSQVVFGASRAAHVHLPSIYDLSTLDRGGDVLRIRRGAEGIEVELLATPGEDLRLLWLRSAEGQRTAPAPGWAQADSVALERRGPLCDDPSAAAGLSGRIVNATPTADISDPFHYLYLYDCSERSEDPSASPRQIASLALSPQLQPLRIYPRRAHQQRPQISWQPHQLSMTGDSLVAFGSQQQLPIEGALMVEVPAPSSEFAVLLPPEDLFDCAAWKRENGQEEDSSPGARSCWLRAGAFTFDLRLLKPDPRQSGLQLAWLFLLFLPAVLLSGLIGAGVLGVQGAEAARRSRAHRVALFGVLSASLMAWRLVWAQRLDALNPDTWALLGPQTWFNEGAAIVLSAVVLHATLLPFAQTRSGGSSWLTRLGGAHAVAAGWMVLHLCTLAARLPEWALARSVVQPALAGAALLLVAWDLCSVAWARRALAWLHERLPLRVREVGGAELCALALLAVVVGLLAAASLGRSAQAARALLLLSYAGLGLLAWSSARLGARLGEPTEERWTRAQLMDVSLLMVACFCVQGPGRSWLPDFGMLIAYGFPIGALGFSAGLFEGGARWTSTLGRESTAARPPSVLLGWAAGGVLVGIAGLGAGFADRPGALARLLTLGALIGAPLGVTALLGWRLWLRQRVSGQAASLRWPEAQLLGALVMATTLCAALALDTARLTRTVLMYAPGDTAARLTMLIEPWITALRAPDQAGKSIASWLELWRPSDAAPDLAAFLTGEGFLLADIFDRGVIKSLNNDYLSILVLREAGMVGLLATVALIWMFLSLAAWRRPGSEEAGSASPNVGKVVRPVTLALMVVVAYQPLAAFGMLPFTGVPIPAMGLDSWGDLWATVALVVVSLSAQGPEAGSRADGGVSQAPSVSVRASLILGALALVGSTAVAWSAVHRPMQIRGVAEGSADPMEGVGSLPGEAGIFGLQALKAAVQDERALQEKLKTGLWDNRLVADSFAAFADDWDRQVREDGLLRRLVEDGTREEFGCGLGDIDEQKLPAGLKVSSSGQRWTEARYSLGWPTLILKCKGGEGVSAELDLNHEVASYFSPRLARPRDRWRLVARPEGATSRDVAELSTQGLTVRLRPGDAAQELVVDDKDGYLAASRLSLARSLKLVVDEAGRPTLQRSGDDVVSDGGHGTGSFRTLLRRVISAQPGQGALRSLGAEGAGWRKADLAPGQEVILERGETYLLLLNTPPGSGRPLWILRTAGERGLPTILADDVALFPGRQHRVYPFSSLLPVLGFWDARTGTTIGLDGWYGEWRRQQRSDPTADRDLSTASAEFASKHCGPDRGQAKNPLWPAPEAREAPLSPTRPKKGQAPEAPSLCSPSDSGAVDECEVTLQPELTLHLAHLLELTAAHPESFAPRTKEVRPAFQADMVLLRADSQGVVAHAHHRVGRESSALAPRTPERGRALRTLLDFQSLERPLKEACQTPSEQQGLVKTALFKRYWPWLIGALRAELGESAPSPDADPTQVLRSSCPQLLESVDWHPGATRFAWADPPVAVGSTIKPLVAAAFQRTDPDWASRMKLAPLSVKRICRGAETYTPYGFCPTRDLELGADRGPLGMKDFLRLSRNWFQAKLGLLLPGLGGGVWRELGGTTSPSAEAPWEGNDPEQWERRPQPRLIQLEAGGGEVLNPGDGTDSLNLTLLRGTPGWKSLEEVIGRPLHLGEDGAVDLCAVRSAPLRLRASPTTLQRSVALGAAGFNIVGSRAELGQETVDMRAYFNFLRGGGAFPTMTLLQLADAYLRVFKQGYLEGQGTAKQTGVAASWFPLGSRGSSQVSGMGLDCRSPGGGQEAHSSAANEVGQGLCAAIRHGGTAAALRDVKGVVYHGGKTGTIDSLGDLTGAARRDFNRSHTVEGKTQPYQLSNEPPNDSLFVVAFSVKRGPQALPFILALRYQGIHPRHGTGYAVQIAHHFVQQIADYYGEPTPTAP